MLAANIAFEDNKFAEILSKGSFDLNTLETFITLLNYIKNKIANGEGANINKKYQLATESFAKKLSKHFEIYVGKNKPTIIINKINELLSFHPELLNDKKTSHKK